MQRKWHETEILKNLQPALEIKTYFNEQKLEVSVLWHTKDYFANSLKKASLFVLLVNLEV